jgi:hypothetical protein
MAPIHPDRARLLGDALRRGGRYGSEQRDQQGTYDERPTRRPRGGRQERESQENQARRVEESTLIQRSSKSGRERGGDYERGNERDHKRGYDRSDERGFGRTQERDNEKDSNEGKETTGSKRRRPGQSARRKRVFDEEGALLEGARDNERSSEGEQKLGSPKRAKHNHTEQPSSRAPTPLSRRQRRLAARSSGQDVSSLLPPAQRHQLELEKAREVAVDYPKLWDTKAWRELGEETDQEVFKKHANVYWHLRLEERPQDYKVKGWKRKLHREMEDRGFEEMKDAAEHVEKKAEVVEKKEEVKDDVFDIDIYGDEETRAKYEPWIKSTMMKT